MRGSKNSYVFGVVGLIIVVLISYILVGNPAKTSRTELLTSKKAEDIEDINEPLLIEKNEGEENVVDTGSEDEVDLKITFKEQPHSTALIDEPFKMIDIYDEYAEKAEDGDIHAIELMISSLTSCKAAWKTVEERDRAIAVAKNTGMIQVRPDLEPVKADEPDEIEIAVEIMIQDSEFCDGVSDEQIERYKEFVKIGVENRNAYSYEVAIESASSEYEAFELEKSLWESVGHIDGAIALSDRYFNGVTDSEGKNVAPDYELSFAYLRVEEILHSFGKRYYDRYIHNPHHVLSERLNYVRFQHFEKRNARYTGYLSPDEELAANERAIEIIKANENCCALIR